MVGTLLGLPEPPAPTTRPTRSRSRSATAAAPGAGRGRGPSAPRAGEPDDRRGPRRGPGQAAGPRRDRCRRGRLPAHRLGRDAEGGAGDGPRGVPPHQLVAREDALALYGFASEEERELFGELVSVSGVGPKVAIAALSGGPARELLRAIAAGDAKRFQAVPGSASGPRSGSSSSCARRSPGPSRRRSRSASGRGRRPARSPATAWSTSATRRWRPSSCSTGSRAATPRS